MLWLAFIAAIVRAAFSGKVYCSGPLFDPGERWEMANIAVTLERSGFETFLPQRDGLEVLLPSLTTASAIFPDISVFHRFRTFLSNAIFKVDIFQLLTSDAVVTSLNGRTPDDGALVEAATCFSVDSCQLVLYKADYRSEFSGADNGMITALVGGSDNEAKSLAEISERVEQVLQGGPVGGVPENLSERLRRTYEEGKLYWEIFRVLRRKFGEDFDEILKGLGDVFLKTDS